MPQTIQYPKNLWGVELDPQRNDLWQLQLSQVVNYMNNVLSTADIGAKGAKFVAMLPAESTAVFYSTSVELPNQAITAQAVTRQTTPYAMPGVDEVLAPVRVTFLHDTNGGSYDGSTIYAILALWRALVRTGRGGVSASDMSIPLGSYIDPTTRTRSLSPRYTFDVPVELYKGGSKNMGFASRLFGTPDIVVGDNNTGIDYSAGYLIKGMWLQSIQIGALRYSGGTQLLEINTTFGAADITVIQAKASGPTRVTPGLYA